MTGGGRVGLRPEPSLAYILTLQLTYPSLVCALNILQNLYHLNKVLFYILEMLLELFLFLPAFCCLSLEPLILFTLSSTQIFFLYLLGGFNIHLSPF